jgi:hypothetical protein
MMLARAAVNVVYPADLAEKSYAPKFRETAIVFRRAPLEYRVALRGVTRTESPIPASSLVTADPRLLSQRQRDARLEVLKARAGYSKNPEYAIHLDVDCVQFEPERLKPSEYILECDSVVRSDFLRLLTSLK